MLVFIVLWLLFALGVGIYASSCGRSALVWFVVALFVSPLVCAVILTVVPSGETAEGLTTSVEVATAAETLQRLAVLLERGALAPGELGQLRALAAREQPTPKSREPQRSAFTRPCPRCDKLVHPQARTCMHCWAKLQQSA